MAGFTKFLLAFIPGLAFAMHSIVDYRKATGKPVGTIVIYFCRVLTTLVLLELVFFAWFFIFRT